jgi:hypothetical protein
VLFTGAIATNRLHFLSANMAAILSCKSWENKPALLDTQIKYLLGSLLLLIEEIPLGIKIATKSR